MMGVEGRAACGAVLFLFCADAWLEPKKPRREATGDVRPPSRARNQACEPRRRETRAPAPAGTGAQGRAREPRAAIGRSGRPGRRKGGRMTPYAGVMKGKGKRYWNLYLAGPRLQLSGSEIRRAGRGPQGQASGPGEGKWPRGYGQASRRVTGGGSGTGGSAEAWRRRRWRRSWWPRWPWPSRSARNRRRPACFPAFPARAAIPPPAGRRFPPAVDRQRSRRASPPAGCFPFRARRAARRAAA